MVKKVVKKKAKKPAEDDVAKTEVNNTPTLLPPPPTTPLITLHLHLLNWPYMNHTIPHLPTSTFMFTIRNLLKERHGRIKDLVVCYEMFKEEREIGDDMMTLEEIMELFKNVFVAQNTPKGVGGSRGISNNNNNNVSVEVTNVGDGEKEKEVKFVYDFKPFDCTEPNPILLDWNC